MSDYAERLRRKMSGPADQLPSSPYAPIGTVSGSLQPATTDRTNNAGSTNRRQYFAAFAATMGNLVMGTTICWSGPAIPYLQKSPAEDGFNITDSQGSWIGSLMPLGALVGGPIGGLLINKLGKKGTMFITAALFALAYLVIIIAPNLILIYIGRFWCGMGTGISSLVCPVYVAEIAKPEIRGLLGSGVQVMVVWGVLLGIAAGALVSWRWLSVICLVMVVVWAVLLIPIPESPAQLLANKQYRAARESLEWLRETVYVEEEYEEIQRGVEESEGSSAGIGELMKPQNLLPFVISMYLMLGQQFSGMNAVLFYVDGIFEAAGSTLDSSLASIIVAVVQVVATILAAAVMDKLGRRLLLNISSFLMVISITALGAYFYIKINLGDTELANRLQILPIASLSIFVFAFSVGFGPIPWLMMSELFSPEVRGLASSIATCFNWTLAFVVTKFFSNLVSAITEAGSFWVFGGITALTFLFCLLFVPETKGKSLEAIQDMFRSSQPYFFKIGLWKLCCGRSGDTLLLVEPEDPE